MKNAAAWMWRGLWILYWVAMAAGSHWPRLNISDQFGLEDTYFSLGVDKWAHILAYAGLAWLTLMAGVFRGRTPRRLALVVVMLMAYSVVDELTQGFVDGREPSVADFFASSVGGAVGAAFWLLTRWAFGGDAALADFVGHARLVSAVTLASRALGLLRDRVLAWGFGFGPAMDAFTLAFIIPNLFRRLFGEGALAAALVPQYARLRDVPAEAGGAGDGDCETPSGDTAAPSRSAENLVYLVMHAVAGGLAAAAIAAATVLGMLVLFGALDGRGDLAARLVIVTIWYAPLVCLAAVLGAVLQVHGRFFVPAASPIVMNLCLIVATYGAVRGLTGADTPLRLVVVAAAVVVAGVLQLAWHVAAVRRRGLRVHPGTGPRRVWAEDPEARLAARRLVGQWAPTVIGLSVFQLNVLLDVVIAMLFSGSPSDRFELFGLSAAMPMREGDVGVLGMAQRLYEFPLGVFAIAVATALFPRLADAARDPDRYAGLLRSGLRLTVFIGLPASVGLLMVREPLARVIYYQGGRLVEADAGRIATVLAGYAPAIWAFSMNHVLTRAFYAVGAATIPMRVSIAMVALNIVLNLALIWPLGAAGLAAATSFCAIVQCVTLALLLGRRGVRLTDAAVWGSWARVAGITVVMGVVVWLLVAPVDLQDLGWVRTGSVLAAGTLGGLVVFMIGAKLLRLEELRWIISGRVE